MPQKLVRFMFCAFFSSAPLAKNIIVFFLFLSLSHPKIHAQETLGKNTEGSTIRYIAGDTVAINTQMTAAKLLLEYSPDSAAALYTITLSESRKIGYQNGISTSILSLGKAYAQQGRYQEAIKLWQNGIAFMYATNWRNNKLSFFYANTGAVFGILGDYETAITYSYKAIDVAQDDEQMIAAYNNVSTILQHTPNVSINRPLYYLDLAIQKAKAIHNNKLLASTLTNKGTLYIQQQDWKKGKHYFDSALALANIAALPEVRYSTLLSLGELYLSLHQPDAALVYLLQLKEPGNIQINPFYTSLCDLRLGAAYIQLKEYAKAKKAITEAEAASKKLGLKTYRVQVYETLSRLYSELGSYEKSLFFFKEYATLKDSIFQQRTIDRVNEMDIKYNTAQKEQQIIANRLLIANQQNRIHLNNLLLIAVCGGILFLTIILIFVSKNARQNKSSCCATVLSPILRQ